MRLLKFLVVAMGVLIVIGTTTLVVLIIQRSTQSGVSGAGTQSGGPLERQLDEPVGTRITAITPAGDRLALHLQGGGPDRVLLIDPRTGLITARVGLLR